MGIDGPSKTSLRLSQTFKRGKKMTNPNCGKFCLKITWGDRQTREENPCPCEYDFKTEAERTAFLQGVDESSGWLDYEIVAGEDGVTHLFPVSM